jgi:hypothetical protein
VRPPYFSAQARRASTAAIGARQIAEGESLAAMITEPATFPFFPNLLPI